MRAPRRSKRPNLKPSARPKRRLPEPPLGLPSKPLADKTLARIARGDHPSVKLGADDTVIFSSRVIPGNERAIGEIQNQLAERAGVSVATVSAVEIGKTCPRLDVAAKLLTALGVEFRLLGTVTLPAVAPSEPVKPRGRPRKS